MAGPEMTQCVDHGDEDIVELSRLRGEGSLVSVRVLFDSKLSDLPSVGRLSREDSLVDLMSGPRSPDPQHVGVVEVGEPADLHVIPSEAVVQQ